MRSIKKIKRIMKKKKTNLGKIVLTFENYKDFQKQFHNDCDVMLQEFVKVVEQFNLHVIYDQEVLVYCLTNILAGTVAFIENGEPHYEEEAMKKYKELLNYYREQNSH